ncbi:MAG: carboxypeptidase-like regulatory domain-containing protein [Acidobacteriaceae bacterium]
MSEGVGISFSRRLFVPGARALRAAAYCLALAGLLAVVHPAARGQDEFGIKNLQGKVLNAHDVAISGAIVYLQNSRNNDVKSFISTSNGSFRFADLSADTDYTVWAAFHGKKSSTRQVSSFDTRKNVYLDLHNRE